MIILLLVALASVFGLAVLSMIIGERIQGTFGRSDWFIGLTGSIVLVSFMNVPFIGEKKNHNLEGVTPPRHLPTIRVTAAYPEDDGLLRKRERHLM